MSGVDGMIPGGDSATHTHPASGLQVILRSIRGVTHPKLLKRPYHFQIAPLEEFGWDAAAEWNDYVTVKGGSYSRPGGRALRTIPLQSMVVDWNPTWAVYAGGNRHHPRDEDGAAPDPRKVSWELDKLCNEMSPFKLIVWNKGLSDYPELNLAVTFRTFSPRERAGELDSRYFEMSFTEYRTPKLRRRGYSGGKPDLPKKVRVDADGVAQEMDDGEPKGKIGTPSNPATLRKLAQHFYGESSMWKVIAALNGVTGIGGDETLAHLKRHGRKYATLQIARKDAFSSGNGSIQFPG